MRRFGLLVQSTAAAAAVLSCLCLTHPTAAADDVKYAELFKKDVLNCLHPTVKADAATIEQTKGPDKAGDITTVRLKIYYPGLIKKDVMEAELMVRQSGSIRQMKVNVLADSATHKPCELEKNWKDF